MMEWATFFAVMCAVLTVLGSLGWGNAVHYRRLYLEELLRRYEREERDPCP
jgi:hypothetical protein